MINEIDWSQAFIKKISVRIDGHPTSIALEDCYLSILKGESRRQKLAFSAFVRLVDKARPEGVNLSAALRIAALHLAHIRS